MLRTVNGARMRGRADGTLWDHRAWGGLLRLTPFEQRQGVSIPKCVFFVNAAVVHCNKNEVGGFGNVVVGVGPTGPWGFSFPSIFGAFRVEVADAVPEPSTLGLIGLGLLGLGAMKRRRRYKLPIAAALACLLCTPASATAINQSAVFGPGPLDVVPLSGQALAFNFTDMPNVGGTQRPVGAFLELAGTGITGNGLNVSLYEDLNAAGTPFATSQTGPGTFPVLRDFGAIKPAASRCKPPVLQFLFH
jgi:hypothetical protein